MKIQYYVFGILLVLLFAGCTSPKEIVYLPIVEQTVEKESFMSEVQITDYEQIELSGNYAIITTDNVQIKNIIYESIFKNTKQGSELSFAGAKWTLQSLDCSKKQILISNSQNSITLSESEKYHSNWDVLLECDETYLYGIKLSSSESITATSGDMVYIPDSSPGYKLQYLQKGEFKLAN
ncbi:MAG: hypothetical protein WC501_00610 [Candidatus Micrarchaeia archaeon]